MQDCSKWWSSSHETISFSSVEPWCQTNTPERITCAFASAIMDRHTVREPRRLVRHTEYLLQRRKLVPWYIIMTDSRNDGPCLLFPRGTKTLVFGCTAVTSASAFAGSWNTRHGKQSGNFDDLWTRSPRGATRRRWRRGDDGQQRVSQQCRLQLVIGVSNSLMKWIAEKAQDAENKSRHSETHLKQNTLHHLSSNTVRSAASCANNGDKVPMPD